MKIMCPRSISRTCQSCVKVKFEYYSFQPVQRPSLWAPGDGNSVGRHSDGVNYDVTNGQEPDVDVNTLTMNNLPTQPPFSTFLQGHKQMQVDLIHILR